VSVTPEQLDVLMKDLTPTRVKSRSQGGATLSYLEAWDVKAMLIRVFGFTGFDAEVLETKVLETIREEATDRNNKAYTKVTVSAMCTVRLTIHGAEIAAPDGTVFRGRDTVFTETSAASQTGRDVGEVTDFAIKTAESDALKRCATYLGTQFGLSLYRNGQTSDVIKKIVAPGQEWPREGDKPKLSEDQQKMLADSLGAQEVASESLLSEDVPQG
jgi:recombination DNA repair RAD52 pathway protein